MAGVVFAEGGAGCGKSTFLAEVARDLAASGALVLSAGGVGAERHVPLNVLRQLLNNQEIPHDRQVDLARILLNGGEAETPSVGRAVGSPTSGEPGWTVTMQQLCAVFRGMASAAPLVIAIDDMQHADSVSLECLLYTVRTSRRARILLICTVDPSHQSTDPVPDADFLRLPAFHRVVLSPLSRDGVSRLLSTRSEQQAESHILAYVLGATGGNPLLLRSLLEEHRRGIPYPAPAEATMPGESADPSGDSSQVAVGGYFYRAALACVSSMGPIPREIAGALAVLGPSGSSETLTKVLHRSAASVAWGLRALDMAGLTETGRLRHPLIAAAALDALPPGHLSRLHQRTAKLLYDRGAPALEIARHLLATGHAADRWAVPILRHAAEEALADDEVTLANACLELSLGMCADEQQRADIRIRLALTTWRINHSAAAQRLTELVADLHAGNLGATQTASLAGLLIARGCLDEAGEALDRLPGRRDSAGRPTDVHCHLSGLWASAEYPVPFAHAFGRPTAQESGEAVQAASGEVPGLAAAASAWSMPGDGSSASAAESAAHVLRHFPLGDTTLPLVTNAVRTLARAGKTDSAVHWCNKLLSEATRRGAPGWQAEFAAVQAEISLSLGLLKDAEEQADQAMTCVPPGGDSVFMGSPLATLIMVFTVMGRYDEATQRVNRPVPETLYRSTYGLGYLRARGHFYLATNRALAAVSDFINAGRIATRWGLDCPEILPWRTDAAQAFLRLGYRARAGQLIKEQLSRSRGRSAHVLGVSLRLCARLVESAERPRLLTEAVDALQTCGDRLELARALADLGAAHQGMGELARASILTRRAWRMAKECGAKPLCEEIIPGGEREEHAGRTRTGLSESEMRVAVLAAHGNTNREISIKLCVTVSTVEQHLTKVFRKLGISRRQQLPARLQVALGGSDARVARS
ncbi:LuxR family transcriptional regulator [Streptomyces stramineus]|uniref:LuxR family transcriptional regulator n=1 Tax=Streptomyces stramineus TaxID=173861 RepID=A0ABN1A4P1_9ACTN